MMLKKASFCRGIFLDIFEFGFILCSLIMQLYIYIYVPSFYMRESLSVGFIYVSDSL